MNYKYCARLLFALKVLGTPRRSLSYQITTGENTDMSNTIPWIYRYDDLKNLFKISRSSLARWESKGSFPKRIKIGENSIGWRSDEVRQWLEERSNTKQEIK